MKNIICIDLTKFNNEKLVDVAKMIGIDYDALLHNKKAGFVKLFIDKLSGKTIAFTTKEDKESINYTEFFTEMLKSIEPFILSKKEPKELTVDGILDKISKYGIESLSVNEKKFLDENSN